MGLGLSQYVACLQLKLAGCIRHRTTDADLWIGDVYMWLSKARRAMFHAVDILERASDAVDEPVSPGWTHIGQEEAVDFCSGIIRKLGKQLPTYTPHPSRISA